MTYKKIYNQLDRAGLIDKILVNSNFDKIGIIRGIEYLEYFIGTSTFKGMTYWNEKHSTTENMVCREYAKLQIENMKKDLAAYEYMLKTML